MKPLQWVALGYLVTALYARTHGLDLLADPVGWVMIAVGTARLPPFDLQRTQLGLAGLAGLVAAALWVPPVAAALDRADPSLAWAADLPALAFTVMLCRHLVAASAAAGERVAPHVYRATVTATLVVAALPVLVFGGGLTSWGPPADAAGQLLRLALVVVMVSWASSTWAGVSTPPLATGRTRPTRTGRGRRSDPHSDTGV